MQKTVYEQIESKNPWYVGDQVEWANKPEIKPIYRMRRKFLSSAIVQLQKQVTDRNLKVLDLGCGDGYWTSTLTLIQHLDVYALDYNSVRLERAKKNAPLATFIEGDINKLIKEMKNQFDLIWFSQVIEHIEDDENVLKMLGSLLSPKGVLIIGTPNEGNYWHELHQRKTNYRKNSDHVHFYTVSEFKKKLNNVGFEICESLYEPCCFWGEQKFYKWMKKPVKRFIITVLAKIIPSWCSDFYFLCKKK